MQIEEPEKITDEFTKVLEVLQNELPTTAQSTHLLEVFLTMKRFCSTYNPLEREAVLLQFQQLFGQESVICQGSVEWKAQYQENLLRFKDTLHQLHRSSQTSKTLVVVYFWKNYLPYYSFLNSANSQDTQLLEFFFQSLTHTENKVREQALELLIESTEKMQKQDDIVRRLLQCLDQAFVPLEKEQQRQLKLKNVLLQQQQQQDQPANAYYAVKQQYKDDLYAKSFCSSEISNFSEFYLIALSQLIAKGLVSNFEQLLPCLEVSILHIKKHIRKAAVQILEQISAKIASPQCTNILLAGLVDDFTTVRMEALKAVRKIFQQKNELKNDSKILAALCLSRHHPAEGVHKYARELWADVYAQEGRQLVATNILTCLKHDCDQCYSQSFEIRTAASLALNEIMLRIMNFDETCTKTVRESANLIGEALLNTAHYEVYPLAREEGMKSLAIFAEVMPIAPQIAARMLEAAWFHLPDQCSGVKAHAAQVIVRVAAQSQEFTSQMLFERLKTELKSVKNRSLNNEVEEFDRYQLGEQQVAIPKQRMINRHVADALEGIAYLILDFAAQKKQQEEVILELLHLQSENLQRVSDVVPGNENLFASTVTLFAKTLSYIAKNNVKKLVEGALDGLFELYSQDSSELLRKSVEFALREMARLIGFNILRGRIENYENSKYLQQFDSMNIQNK